MCKPFSCIVHRTRGVLVGKRLGTHSHTQILLDHGISDVTKFDALSRRPFVKIELTPWPRVGQASLIDTQVSSWRFTVDEVDWPLPSWFTSIQDTHEKRCRIAAAAWQLAVKAKVAAPKLTPAQAAIARRRVKSLSAELLKASRSAMAKTKVLKEAICKIELARCREIAKLTKERYRLLTRLQNPVIARDSALRRLLAR